ncbi:MAG: hypothetical protein MZV49_20895 [Rhodopseudomonas palustris]|nr:hypothetical protein [Rhodopseudomonas palustris]
MRVFNIPPSAPFLRTLITALVDGELIAGFAPRRAGAAGAGHALSADPARDAAGARDLPRGAGR